MNTSNRYIAFLLSVSVITGVVQRYNQLSIRMQKKGFAYSFLEISSKVSNVLATLFLAIFVTRSFYAVVWGQIIGNLSVLILGFAIDKQNRRFYLPSIKLINEYLKYGLPMIPSVLLYWALSSVDRIVLRRFSTFSEIGLYSAAFKVNIIFSIFTTGFLAYWKPLAFEKNEKDRNKQFFKRATSLVNFIMFFIGMFALMLKDVIVLIMDKSYRNVTYIMPFLILIPIMTIISETTVMGIYFQKKTYWHIAIASISVVLNYLGNLVLVPSLGARGAAISTGLSYVFLMVLRTYISKRIYPVEYEFGKLISGTLVTIVVAFVYTFSYYLAGFLASLIGIGVLVFLYGNEFRLVVSVLKDVRNRFAGNKVKNN
ncbi:polysaccharide biosynthesis C-terminal domain-containing protein [Thermotoga sp. Ku-13t]|uniref:oligosaccharide flippase family protein n=1 Tax=Thermotoga sp. Ku-13t TaxID=1755813 RepID=UPI0013ECAB2D|nr:polysaccharide biosynthesis C-terminal domain-containing protein [Thermotoga sp. Ku-13t]